MINPPTKVRIVWNLFICGVFIGVLVLAYFSAPPPRPDFFTPQTTAKFPFSITRVGMVESRIVSTIVIGGGMITFSGKGGISAGNSLTVNITVFFDRTLMDKEPSNVTVKLQGAFHDPVPPPDSHGVIGYIAIGLAKQGDSWVANLIPVKYDQGGSLPILLNVDNVDLVVPAHIEMGSQDVTVATRTNSLILSLTWAILGFAALELRVDNERHERK